MSELSSSPAFLTPKSVASGTLQVSGTIYSSLNKPHISFLAQTFILPIMFLLIFPLVDSKTFILQDQISCVFSSVKLFLIQPSRIDDSLLFTPLGPSPNC